ncbi:hypothetical protein GWI33_013229, partial [Rhynchophorus ferrugineus]
METNFVADGFSITRHCRPLFSLKNPDIEKQERRPRRRPRHAEIDTVRGV